MIALPMLIMLVLGIGIGVWIAAPAVREWAKGNLIAKPVEKDKTND